MPSFQGLGSAASCTSSCKTLLLTWHSLQWPQVNWSCKSIGPVFSYVPRLLNLQPSFAQVKDHNSIQSKAGKLEGSKAQAAKNILNSVPASVKKLIVDYSVEVGFEMTPWSDDSLGSKKWLPGYALLGCSHYPISFPWNDTRFFFHPRMP